MNVFTHRANHQQQHNPKESTYTISKESPLSSQWQTTKDSRINEEQQNIQKKQQQVLLQQSQQYYGWNLDIVQLKRVSPFQQISNDCILRIPKSLTSLQTIFNTIYDVLRQYSIQATFVNEPVVVAQCQYVMIPSSSNLILEFNINVWDDNTKNDSSYLIEMNYVSGDTITYQMLCKNDILKLLSSQLLVLPSSFRNKEESGSSSIFDAYANGSDVFSSNKFSSNDDNEFEYATMQQHYEVTQSLVSHAITIAAATSAAARDDDKNVNNGTDDWWMLPQKPSISSALQMIDKFYFQESNCSSLLQQPSNIGSSGRSPRNNDLERIGFSMILQMTNPNQNGYELAYETSQRIFLYSTQTHENYPSIRQSIFSALLKNDNDKYDDQQQVMIAMSIILQCLSLWNSQEITSFISSMDRQIYDFVDHLIQRYIVTTSLLSSNTTMVTLTIQILSIIMNQHNNNDIKQYVNDRYYNMIQQIHEYGTHHHTKLEYYTNQILLQCNNNIVLTAI